MAKRAIRIVGELAKKQGAGRVSGGAAGKSVSARAIVLTVGPQRDWRGSSGQPGCRMRDVGRLCARGPAGFGRFWFEILRQHCVHLEDAEQSLATIADERDGVPPIHGVLIR